MYPAALVEQARSVPSTYLGVLRGGKELGLWMGREGKGKVGGNVPSACSIDSCLLDSELVTKIFKEMILNAN